MIPYERNKCNILSFIPPVRRAGILNAANKLKCSYEIYLACSLFLHSQPNTISLAKTYARGTITRS